MSQPVAIALYMYADPSQPTATVERVLDAFEGSAKTTPTHWGHNEREILNYDRKGVLAKCGEPPYFFLHRKAAIKYTGYCDLGRDQFLTFKFDKAVPASKWTEILDLADRLAIATRVRFGLLHIFYPTKTLWVTQRDRFERWLTLGAQPTPNRFRPSGPLTLGMRTYFGGDILEMFDRDLLLSTPGAVMELPPGIVRVDLSEDLLNLKLEDTVDLWTKAREHLEPSHALAKPVFEKDRRTVDFEPSQAWTRHRKEK